MTDAPITAGLYPDMLPETYHADPAPAPSLSSTLARKLLNQSPLHAWTASPRLNPDFEPEIKDSFDFGSAVHTSLLSIGSKVLVIDADSFRTKDAQQARDDARALGRVPLLMHQAEAVDRCESAVRRRLMDLGLGRVFTDPRRSEQAAFAEIDGIWCRCQIDFLGHDGWLYDLKTTTDASPEAVRRTVENYGYHVQASHYLETWRAAGGEAKGLRFVFVEKTPPHEVTVVELLDKPGDDEDWGQMAREQTAEARRMWRECLEADHWPGYPETILTIGAPHWASEKWSERESVLALSRAKPSARAREMAHEMQAP